MFELLAGNAGIALGALPAGDVELAVLAVTLGGNRRQRSPSVSWKPRDVPILEQ
ncbi:MAG: hypothetical protein M3Y48_07115 [Actinomycetota bacterium]|nr:hypothetical protein [Actinomycetota bacterium]